MQNSDTRRVEDRSPSRCCFDVQGQLAVLRGSSMEVGVVTRGRVHVGPDGLVHRVPRTARITLTGKDPYDVDIRLNWDDDEQRLVAEDARISRRLDGLPVRVTEVAKMRIGDLIAASLTAEVLDTRGWAGVVEDNPHEDPAAVKAPIYAGAPARGHNPTQTVALVHGLQPGSAIKRVMRARDLGYPGEARKGRSRGPSAPASA